MTTQLEGIVDLENHPVRSAGFAQQCRDTLDRTGSLLLPGFLTGPAISGITQESLDRAHLAYYCQQSHTAYLSAPDPSLPAHHTRNRMVDSSKGCITDDQVPASSSLRRLYIEPGFRSFLCLVLGERRLYEYADPLSSINVHYYQQGQELGWHFDNSAFAVTLMIQAPLAGGHFEYIAGLRDFGAGDMNFQGVGEALDGETEATTLDIRAGTLALFRGRNALHRVTPVQGERSRIQVVLAYNTEPGIALSEEARMTFFGRVE